MKYLLCLLTFFFCCPEIKAGLVIETADGLPIEVEMISLYRDELTVRNTASKRILRLKYSKLSAETHEKIDAAIEEKRKSIKTVTLTCLLIDNPNAKKPMSLEQRGFLLLEQGRGTSPGTATLPPMHRCLRISGNTTMGIDMPLDVFIWWENDSGVMTSETAKLIITSVNADYFSKSFLRTNYRSHAVIAVNPANGAVVYKTAGSNSTLAKAEAMMAQKEQR